MAGPMPGLLTLIEELYGRMNKERLFGSGVRGAATRGLLGADAPPDATPREMEVYRNFANASMALAAAPVAATRAIRGAKSAKTLADAPQAQALETARQNAVRMLGLPENNTAMDRARAMGYPMDLYMSGHYPISYSNTLKKPTTPIKNAQKIKAELEQLGIPVRGEQAGTGSTYLSFPTNPYNFDLAHGGGISVPIEQMRFATHSKRADGIPINKPDNVFVADVFPKHGNTLDEARRAIQSMIEKGGIRSRFAAFDPARIKDKDLLASLAAMGITLPLTMGLLSEQPD